MVTDTQVRKLMKEYEKDQNLSRAAMKADMDRKTARKYLDADKLPSETKKPRHWRTRKDPFRDDWPDIEAKLEDAPELAAKTLFDDLRRRRPGKYSDGQLRTMQRRVKKWRAEKGPPKEVFFPQRHRPGEAMQTDFTWANELEITIGGQPFEHMLCNVVLPYSNWQWVTICRSESMAAIKKGVQQAVFRLGKVPTHHQTDNSTAATHSLGTKKRDFNDEYMALMRHLGMKPRTIQIGKSHQNGDVEALGGVLKRRLKQHLLLRASRDFDSVDDYQSWLEGVVKQANAHRQKRLDEELKAMDTLTVDRLPAFSEKRVKVTSWSTIRIKRNAYSVPSRLIGERVVARIYDERIEVFYGQSHQLTIPRLGGEGSHRIDYRHIIWSLVRKPAAFERYRYRQALFPTLVFRKAYDVLCERLTARSADLEYLRILHLAASTMESDVEMALSLLLDSGGLKSCEDVRELVSPVNTEIPQMEPPDVDLDSYDALLSGQGGGR